MPGQKFWQFKHSLCNRHVNTRLRLRLFDAVNTPTAFYGLETAPLTACHNERMDALQRKVLRTTASWNHKDSDNWETMGKPMKTRLHIALLLFPIKPWSETIAFKKSALINRIQSGQAPAWTCAAAEWSPIECRHFNRNHPRQNVGRPRTRWDQHTL